MNDKVDIWEIGNEVNGEWLGKKEDVINKIEAAYTMVKLQGGRAALTLYYNVGCSPTKENELFNWIPAIPIDMRNNLDFVFISYYQEVGTKHVQKKSAYIQHYYNLKVNSKFFVGGYFWWCFRQDMVPWNKDLWSASFNAFIGENKQFS